MTENSPSHEELSEYLRCVIYDLYILAVSIENLKKSKDFALIEVFKTSGLLKLRAIHHFFYPPDKCRDSIKLKMFDCYTPKNPTDKALDSSVEKWLTMQSIHTYVVHLDKSRVTKKFEKDDTASGKKEGDPIPQPKFEQGNGAVIEASMKLMTQAYDFVDRIRCHPDFQGLNYWGQKYWNGFSSTLNRLTGN